MFKRPLISVLIFVATPCVYADAPPLKTDTVVRQAVAMSAASLQAETFEAQGVCLVRS